MFVVVGEVSENLEFERTVLSTKNRSEIVGVTPGPSFEMVNQVRDVVDDSVCKIFNLSRSQSAVELLKYAEEASV
ncbi:MAG: hypothetical protein DWG77_01075 [Chloroflexi bacterium]|nr:hypothetical protein [Chloroflexota bacterium]